MPNDNRVIFTANEPQEMAFKVDGVPEVGPVGDTVRFDLVDGRVMYLAPDIAQKITAMEIQPGEVFHICRYFGGPRKRSPRWTVWLTSESEQARAIAEGSGTLQLLEQSVAFARSASGKPLPRALEPLQSPEVAGLALSPVGRPEVKRTPPSSPKLAIPWNVAFREVSKWVANELKSNDLQWSDEAQKSMCCTVLIAESKAGRIGPWERGQ